MCYDEFGIPTTQAFWSSSGNLTRVLRHVDKFAEKYFPLDRTYTYFIMEGGHIENNKELIKVLDKMARKEDGTSGGLTGK